MVDASDTPATAEVDARPWWERHWVPILLAVLGVVGMLLGRWLPAVAEWYWGLLIPLFMIFSLVLEWRGQADREGGFWKALGLQALHWLGLALGLWVLLLLEGGDRVPQEAVSPIALLLLCVASYFAGVHFHRGFLLAAGMMAFALLVTAWFEKHLIWILFVVIAALVVQVVVAKRRARRKPG